MAQFVGHGTTLTIGGKEIRCSSITITPCATPADVEFVDLFLDLGKPIEGFMDVDPENFRELLAILNPRPRTLKQFLAAKTERAWRKIKRR